jgi:hypothetical protein
MPTSISTLAHHHGLELVPAVSWGSQNLKNEYGVYIISTSSDPDYLPTSDTPVKFDLNQIQLWLKNAPQIRLDGKAPTINELIQNFKRCWLPDEAIAYIGKAEKQHLSARIKQFYGHAVGKKSPHKGGYWLKLMAEPRPIFIHQILSKKPGDLEKELLSTFMKNVSEQSLSNLRNFQLPLPFANLEYTKGVIKKHGLKDHYQ